jgi:hypothetical protein
MVLAMMRLWDNNKQAIRMSLIDATIRDRAIIDALAVDRAKRFVWPGVVDVMRADQAEEVLKLTSKYAEGGPLSTVRERQSNSMRIGATCCLNNQREIVAQVWT